MKRLHVPVLLVVALILVAGGAWAQMSLGNGSTVHFATAEEAREILTSRDDFVGHMSAFDRAARMKTSKDASEKEYLEFVGRNVLAWENAEKQNLTAAWQRIQTNLTAYRLPFPQKVLLVKTTGKEEGGAPYTRSNAIILPKAVLTTPAAKIQKTLCHELFHILSRANPELRDKLYAVIGFAKCDELEFPADLKPRKITNPDAPANAHCILLKIDGEDQWAVPILYSNTDRYGGGQLFDYLQFRFLVVARRPNSSAIEPVYQGKKLKLVPVQPTSGFREQVGGNTDYIIHPEEILADNFGLLILRESNLSDVPSPQIIRKMEEILQGKKATESGAPANAPKQRR